MLRLSAQVVILEPAGEVRRPPRLWAETAHSDRDNRP